MSNRSPDRDNLRTMPEGIQIVRPCLQHIPPLSDRIRTIIKVVRTPDSSIVVRKLLFNQILIP